MARVNNLSNFLTDVASAIKTKKGDETPILASNFDTEIENLPSGGGTEVEEKDVNFYDYDGKLLYSYTKDEFLALEEMPANPTHTGLTAQGWNWDLTSAKNYATNYVGDDFEIKLVIGQNYVTDDNKTRLYITLEERRTPYLGFAVNGSVIVNWGDGTSETITGTDTTTLISTPHEYQEAGDYIITLDSESEIYLLGNNYYSQIIWNNNSNQYYNNVYRFSLNKVELSENARLGKYVFADCRALETITMPRNMPNPTLYTTRFRYNSSLKAIIIPPAITQLDNDFSSCYGIETISLPNTFTNINGSGGFSSCQNLKNITIPYNTHMGNYTFQEAYRIRSLLATYFWSDTLAGAYSLKKVKIASNVSQINSSSFNNCYSLEKVLCLGNIRSISYKAFQNCYSLVYIDFRNNTNIPSTSNTMFDNVPTDCKIIVPDNLYDSWVANTNWTTWASQIIRVSDWENNE